MKKKTCPICGYDHNDPSHEVQIAIGEEHAYVESQDFDPPVKAEKTISLYIVTTGWDYEGFNGQWVFADEASARAHYESLAAAMRKAEVTGDRIGADFVSLRGPFALGEDMLTTSDRFAYCHPRREAEEAAHQAARQAKLAKDRAARRAKRAVKASEPTDCYAAMRMRDGG